MLNTYTILFWIFFIGLYLVLFNWASDWALVELEQSRKNRNHFRTAVGVFLLGIVWASPVLFILILATIKV